MHNHSSKKSKNLFKNGPRTYEKFSVADSLHPRHNFHCAGGLNPAQGICLYGTEAVINKLTLESIAYR